MPVRPFIIAAAMVAALAFSLACQTDEKPRVTATAVQETTVPATPEPTSTGEARTPSSNVLFAAWSDTTSGWIAAALDAETSNYAEGDAVPFVLRIDDAQPGTTYDLELTYRCLVADRHAFDFIAGLNAEESEPLLTAPGPGRRTPDSTLIVPDDASITFDDSEGAALLAWGAVFSAASGLDPETECTDAKTIVASLVARDSTIVVGWAAHLASEDDWGTANGASSIFAFNFEVRVDGTTKQTVTLLPGAVTD